MKDFFEAQKYIIIALIVIITVTIVSGYFASPQPSFIDNAIDKSPTLIEFSPSAIIEKENDSLLQNINPKVNIANREEKEERAEIRVEEALQIPQISASLIIRREIFSLSLPENSSVYDLMVRAREVHGITFGGREYSGLGFFVDEINGIKSNAGGSSKYWIYSINGKKADVGISQYIVREGDSISWNYEDEE